MSSGVTWHEPSTGGHGGTRSRRAVSRCQQSSVRRCLTATLQYDQVRARNSV